MVWQENDSLIGNTVITYCTYVNNYYFLHILLGLTQITSIFEVTPRPSTIVFKLEKGQICFLLSFNILEKNKNQSNLNSRLSYFITTVIIKNKKLPANVIPRAFIARYFFDGGHRIFQLLIQVVPI